MSGARFAWVAVVLALVGCGDVAGPNLPVASRARASSGSGDPTFVTASATAPPIANPVISFTAVKGQSYTEQMVYTSQGGGKPPVFLTFKLDARSLAALPDGSPIVDGQAVPITITLVDPVHLIVEFEPSGLRFSPDRPAVLRLSWAETDPDVNGDGVVNAADTAATSQLRVWRRESSLLPWEKLPTIVTLQQDEVEADLPGFTSYGIAY